jgi:PhzF family phenazine biosynthesis protein
VKLPIFQVDAFTSQVFRGNPAAVCPLDEWINDATMQAIAAENNLAETAFFVPEGEYYRLRWFTPACEVDLCGHATLASAYVFFNHLNTSQTSIEFETRSGRLSVRREDEMLIMNFPAMPPWKAPAIPEALSQALNVQPKELWQVKSNYFAVYEKEDQIRSVKPNFALLEKLHPFGLCITAPSDNSDFVSRYFAPSYGIPEDPVTGSTHCSLTPYWSQQLKKSALHARQISPRGGELWCEQAGERVSIRGRAALYLEGTISI